MRVQISTFNGQQHETVKLETTVKRTALLADATNAKNPFVENALPVHNMYKLQIKYLFIAVQN